MHIFLLGTLWLKSKRLNLIKRFYFTSAALVQIRSQEKKNIETADDLWMRIEISTVTLSILFPPYKNDPSAYKALDNDTLMDAKEKF